MSAPIIQFSELLKDAIAAGQSVVEGNVVKVIADNGTEIGNATLKVINGGNGTASEAYALTGAVSGGVATTSGLAIMATAPETAFVAMAAALGVAVGVTWYNIDPMLWTNIADALDNAGRTIGGKIVTFFDGDNIYYDETTIEAFKQTLVDAGMFDIYGYEVDTDRLYVPEAFVNLPTIMDTTTRIFNDTETFHNELSSNGGKIGAWGPVGGYEYITVCSYTEGVCTSIKHTNNETGVHYTDTYNGTEHTTRAGHTVYLNNWTNSTNRWQPINPTKLDSEGHSINTIAIDMAEILLFSRRLTPDYLQDGAQFPNNDPFPLRYPNWYPFSYPSGAPSDMPTVYPVKYPASNPAEAPEQYPAQHPEAEPVPETYPEIIPDLPLPDAGVNPYTPPTPDPEVEPVPEPIPEPEIPNTPDNPIDPNEPITPSPALPLVPLPDTVSSNKLFTVYNPTSSQLDQLGGYLWDDNLMEILKKIWQDPLDGIISLSQVYVSPTTGSSHNIILGYLDSGVSSAVVTSQFATVDCGSVDIEELKNNATDYAPFVALHVYLPFIGVVELDVNEFMNGSMSIKYKVDVYTGTCIAEVSCTRTEDMPNGNKIYEFSGNCSQQIPLTSGSASGLLSTVLNGISAGLSIASGGSLGVIAGMSMAGHSLSHEMLHVSHSGNLSANAGILGNRKPFVILTRGQSYDANSYNTFYGFPANKTVYLNNCSGFVKVKAIKLKTTATDSERQEILDLLTEGVFI